MRKHAWMPCLLLTTLLNGCGSTTSSSVVAPPVLDYSAEVQARAADEMETLAPPCPRDAVFGNCSAIHRFVKDYHWMREQARTTQ